MGKTDPRSIVPGVLKQWLQISQKARFPHLGAVAADMDRTEHSPHLVDLEPRTGYIFSSAFWGLSRMES